MIGGRGGKGVNFPEIETSKCEQSAAWGQFRDRANMLHPCCILNVPSPTLRLSTVSFDVSKAFTSRAVMVFLTGVIETPRGKGPALIRYVYSIFPPSSVTYQGKGRKEGEERWKGLL